MVRVHNQGVAFGLGNGSDWAPVVFLCRAGDRAGADHAVGEEGLLQYGTWGKVAVGLLLCGIFGNLTDRPDPGLQALLAWRVHRCWERLKAGYVVDFLDFTIPVINYRWPSFNVADSCIFVAASFLFIGGVREEKKAKMAAKSA
ncbi:MAG: signal peptidase II [Luteolibacter sp.]